MKYHYIIFRSKTGYSLSMYYGTSEDAAIYIKKMISRIYYGGSGWITATSDVKLSEEEQDYLLLDAMI